MTTEQQDWPTRIGKRIKELREARGLSQPALAKLIGWSKSRLSNYEQGIRLPGPEEAVAIAQALSDAVADLGVVSPATVLCLDEPLNGPSVGATMPIASSKNRSHPYGDIPDRWILLYRKMRPEEREYTIAMCALRLRDRGVRLEEPPVGEARAQEKAHGSSVHMEKESDVQEEQYLRDVPGRKDVPDAHNMAGDREGPRRRKSKGSRGP